MQLKLEFLSYWHAGSGQSGGAYADQLVIKDSAGLPYYPGRSLKGVLREAFTTAFYLGWLGDRSDIVDLIFGKEGPNSQGIIAIGNATLTQAERRYFIESKHAVDALYNVKQFTAIDENTGTVVDTSLRSMEVTIPTCLFADIQLDTSLMPDELAHMLNEAFPRWLEKASTLIWSVGARQQKGLGQVIVSPLKEEAA